MTPAPSTSPQDEFKHAHGLLLGLLSGAIAAFHAGDLPFPVPMGPFKWSARISRATQVGAPVVIILREGDQTVGHVEMCIPREFTSDVLRLAMIDAMATLHLDLEDQVTQAKGDPRFIQPVQALLAALPSFPEAVAQARRDRQHVHTILSQHPQGD